LGNPNALRINAMPEYTYKAKIKPNTFRRGTIDAENEKTAINKLLALNYHPVFLKIKSSQKKGRFGLPKKIKVKDIYIFLRQLSNLSLAGLPLVKSLGNIAIQSSNEKLKLVILDIKEKIKKGQTLSEALSSHPEIFSSLEINMIKSAENTGTLPEVATKIADLKEKDIAFSNRVRSAFAYPVLLLSVGLITLFVLTTFVLPKFIVLFEDLGQQLPIITQLLIAISLFLKKYWISIIISVILILFIGKKRLDTANGRIRFDRFKLKIPILKNLIIKIQTARFSRTLASLLENGVPIINSLKIVSDIATNFAFADEIRHIHSLVTKGQHMSEALKNSTIFDKNTLDLIAAGEESGRLEDMLYRIAQMNEAEANQLIDTLIFMLEPILIVSLGVIVGMIVMAILLPIFQMNFLIQ